MTIDQIMTYLPFALIVGYLAWRALKFKQAKKRLPELLQNGGVIVDVRTPEEFRGAANPASINIPISVFDSQWKTLDKSKPVILCCASGARSGVAMGILKKNGFGNVVNAGSWRNTL